MQTPASTAASFTKIIDTGNTGIALHRHHQTWNVKVVMVEAYDSMKMIKTSFLELFYRYILNTTS